MVSRLLKIKQGVTKKDIVQQLNAYIKIITLQFAQKNEDKLTQEDYINYANMKVNLNELTIYRAVQTRDGWNVQRLYQVYSYGYENQQPDLISTLGSL